MAIRLTILAVVMSGALLAGQQPQSPVLESPILPGQAEDFSYLTARWALESVPERLPEPRFFGALTITAFTNQIVVTRERAPQEVYRLDGFATQLGDSRVGFAVLVADGIALTSSRIRQLPGGQSLTIWTDWYRVEGDSMTVESRRSQTRPDGSLLKMDNTRVTLRYRRVR